MSYSAERIDNVVAGFCPATPMVVFWSNEKMITYNVNAESKIRTAMKVAITGIR